jgi:hypothetical protein
MNSTQSFGESYGADIIEVCKYINNTIILHNITNMNFVLHLYPYKSEGFSFRFSVGDILNFANSVKIAITNYNNISEVHLYDTGCNMFEFIEFKNLTKINLYKFVFDLNNILPYIKNENNSEMNKTLRKNIDKLTNLNVLDTLTDYFYYLYEGDMNITVRTQYFSERFGARAPIETRNRIIINFVYTETSEYTFTLN